MELPGSWMGCLAHGCDSRRCARRHSGRTSRPCAVTARMRPGRRARGRHGGRAWAYAAAAAAGGAAEAESDAARGPMPPSPSEELGSGSWRTAHRTSSSIPTTGIFSITTSQMKVQASTAPPPHRIPGDRRSATRSVDRQAPQRQSHVREARDPLQIGHALGDLRRRQPGDALGAELLDVERGDRRAIGHRAREDLVCHRCRGSAEIEPTKPPAKESPAPSDRAPTPGAGPAARRSPPR